jgi:hypothetical protein
MKYGSIEYQYAAPASTGIFFSEAKRAECAPHLDHFQTKITFEEIEREFPDLAAWRQEND